MTNLFSIERPLAVHGLIGGVNAEDNFVSDVAAEGILEFNREGSRFFVVFLSVSQFLQKFAEILHLKIKK